MIIKQRKKWRLCNLDLCLKVSEKINTFPPDSCLKCIRIPTCIIYLCVSELIVLRNFSKQESLIKQCVPNCLFLDSIPTTVQSCLSTSFHLIIYEPQFTSISISISVSQSYTNTAYFSFYIWTHELFYYISI